MHVSMYIVLWSLGLVLGLSLFNCHQVYTGTHLSPNTMGSLKIGSFNVGGIKCPAKRKKVLLYLKKLMLDVAHMLSPEIDKLNTLGWKVLVAAPFNSKARGVVILVRNSLETVLHSTVIDSSDRYVITDTSISETRLVLCNIYAPNSYSKDFFLNLITNLLSFGNKYLILGGDFNIVASPRLDKSSTSSGSF